MARDRTVMQACLLGALVSLLLVGAISSTLIRHAVQVLPLALALLLMRKSWAPCAALALFLFWLFLMILIWLFLAGVSKIITGHFTPAETALTFVIGACCVGGGMASIRARSGAGWWSCAAAFAGFALLQIAAMWLSLQPVFATR